jgi:hypothetical protein
LATTRKNEKPTTPSGGWVVEVRDSCFEI